VAGCQVERDTNELSWISFSKEVHIEAVHQRERWGDEHDKRKEPWDCYWLKGYVASKAVKCGCVPLERIVKELSLSDLLLICTSTKVPFRAFWWQDVIDLHSATIMLRPLSCNRTAR